jgi:arginine deiminase
MTAEIIQLARRQGDTSRLDQPSEMRRISEHAALADELRRARIRILQLESSLTSALRDAVRHHDRALDAERNLEELQRKLEATQDS